MDQTGRDFADLPTYAAFLFFETWATINWDVGMSHQQMLWMQPIDFSANFDSNHVPLHTWICHPPYSLHMACSYIYMFIHSMRDNSHPGFCDLLQDELVFVTREVNGVEEDVG